MPELLFSEAADWDLFDVNMRLGSSGIHGELALDTDGLLREMDLFSIRHGLVSHWQSEEYDVVLGNDALAREIGPRMTRPGASFPELSSGKFLQRASRLPFASHPELRNRTSRWPTGARAVCSNPCNNTR